MKKILLALVLALGVLTPTSGSAAITTDQVYKLNKWMGPVALSVGLGTLIQNAQNFVTSPLASGNVLVGNVSGVAAPVVPSGDATISNTGVISLANTVWKSADVTLSSAQVLALFTTPITVVPAPGAGFVNIVREVYSTLTFGTAAYVCNAAGINVRYTNAGGADVGATLTQGYCQSSSSAIQSVMPSTTALTPVANAPIVLSAGTANPTTGDSPIKVRVFYSVVPSPLP